MHSSTFFAFFLQALCLVPIFAAPTSHQQPEDSVTHRPGDFVGVRPGAYEKKSPDVNLKKISIHPGVIVGGPHPDTGKYPVAMISKKLPHDPPQAPISHFHPDSSVYGNIALHPPHPIGVNDMKAWKDERTGVRQTPVNGANLHKLKGAMAPHVGWRPPTPPPFPAPLPQHQQHAQGSRHGSRAPAPRTGQHVNAHPSGSSSRHPPTGPSGSSSRIGSGGSSSRHPAPGSSHHQGASSSSTPRSHTAQKDYKGKRPAFSSKPGGGYPTRKAGEKRSFRSRGINTY